MLLREAEKRAVELLTEHRSVLDALTNLLLEDETVDGSEVYRLAGLPDRSALPPSVATPATVAPRAWPPPTPAIRTRPFHRAERARGTQPGPGSCSGV
jgi:ATP-dependent Zn proteases